MRAIIKVHTRNGTRSISFDLFFPIAVVVYIVSYKILQWVLTLWSPPGPLMNPILVFAALNILNFLDHRLTKKGISLHPDGIGIEINPAGRWAMQRPKINLLIKFGLANVLFIYVSFWGESLIKLLTTVLLFLVVINNWVQLSQFKKKYLRTS